MLIKKNDLYKSYASYVAVKVVNVRRSKVSTKEDRITIATVSKNTGKAIASTKRTVYADSIRRRYFKTFQ